jgi:hypothetical protein
VAVHLLLTVLQQELYTYILIVNCYSRPRSLIVDQSIYPVHQFKGLLCGYRPVAKIANIPPPRATVLNLRDFPIAFPESFTK